MHQLFVSIITASLLSVCILSNAQQEQEQAINLSFDEALSMSLEKNFGIKQANSNVEMKVQDMKAKKGLYLPKISLAASYVSMSEDISMDLNPIKESITPLYSTLSKYGNFSGVPNPDPNTNPIMPTLPDNISTQVVREQLAQGLEHIEATDWTEVLQKKNFGFVNASFAMPLYAGGKVRAANKAASIYHDEALNDRELKQSEVTTELVERYFGLVLANEALQVREQVLEAMKNHMRDAERLKEEGLIANAEFLHVKVYYSDAEREYKKALRQLSIAQEGLHNTLSMENETTIQPVSKLFITDSIQSLEYFLDQAAMNSLLLKKVEYKKDLAETKHHVELGNFMPEIAVMGTYQLAEQDLSHLVPKSFVGVGLKWNIFEGASRFREINSSKIQIEQIGYIQNKATSDINAVITKNYEELKMHLDEYEDLYNALEFTNEYYRVRQKAFSEGIATASEVSDASLAKAKVEIEMLQAKYRFDKALANILHYAGLSSQFNHYRLLSMSNQTTAASN